MLVRHPLRVGEGGAQRLVPGDNVTERGTQRATVQRTPQPQEDGQMIGRVESVQPIEEPQSLLRVRQGDHGAYAMLWAA
ncbi:hypothetical protein GCM10012284_03520 [Mangrovihabitans endophyticus]|uniref:Uncharacterized protein n=1 Tax=Mangrovihabitans endophyticus TaxID=1751298 RepID=A0A8J3BVT5_9ACTN|nr:hypothetical protein GCM10012284_03520 [Mangrovihabitans endophyticus]